MKPLTFPYALIPKAQQWYRSRVDNQKNHDNKDEEKHNDGADLSHVISLQQLSQFGLHKV